jgi:hypothetical protein
MSRPRFLADNDLNDAIALRPIAIRQARLKPVASSASGRE